jgi:photosystem II stability/assembly factor-like uncharacterized protein
MRTPPLSALLLVSIAIGCDGAMTTTPPRDGDGGAIGVDAARAGGDAGSSEGPLHIVPESMTLAPGAAGRFVARGAGEEPVAVRWSVQEAAGGTIDAEGNFRAPDTEGVYHVVATSEADASTSARATVTVVRAGGCDSLPAPFTWEDITPPSTHDGAVNGTVGAAIIVDAFDPRTVWLGTGSENDEIWRSDDCGATWTRVNTGPGSVGDGMTFGGVGDGAQWSMMVDPVDRNVLYAVSGYGAQSLWKSTDGGESWTDILEDSEYNAHAKYRFVNNVSLDPSDHLHLLVSTHGGCTAPYGPNCMAETHDGGETWRVLVSPEGWVEGGGVVIVQRDVWVWCGTELLMTRDAGATWSNTLEGGGSCEAEYTIRPLVPAANGNYYLGSRSGVLRSSDGFHWEHVPGTGGTMVMIAHGSSHVFAADQWNPSLRWAALDADESWTDLPAPPQIALGTDGGIPFLAYDDVHHIVYASMFSGGVARMVVPE